MRNYHSKSGPFDERPFFKLKEIESICREELQNVNLYPSSPSPIRIDRFIEKRFGIQLTYDDLPEGLLGFTRFNQNGVEEIVISNALDAEGTTPAERRLRSTAAHEVGHGLLHAHLFVLGRQPTSLFGDGLAPDAPKILCREDGLPGAANRSKVKPTYRWWEFQANQAMGALLLPKLLVEKALTPIISVQGVMDVSVLPAANHEDAVQLVAEVFNVNPIVARIRLKDLYPVSDAQLTL